MFFQQKHENAKEIQIENDTIAIKPLSPRNFLDTDDGLPLSIFDLKNVKTMYEKTLEKVGNLPENDLDSEKFLQNVKQIFDKCAISINSNPFKAKQYIEDHDMIEVTYLLCSIYAISFKKFDSILEVSGNQPVFWDAMSRRYGKTPIECLFPTGGYSDMDAYCFNTMILQKGMEAENAVNKKMLAKLKRKK